MAGREVEQLGEPAGKKGRPELVALSCRRSRSLPPWIDWALNYLWALGVAAVLYLVFALPYVLADRPPWTVTSRRGQRP